MAARARGGVTAGLLLESVADFNADESLREFITSPTAHESGTISNCAITLRNQSTFEERRRAREIVRQRDQV